MITLKTITTIELSNICNLECRYCINRLIGPPERVRGIMSEQIFNLSLVWLKILCDKGTQKEVNLNGNGESCLDMDLPERVRRVKSIVGKGMVILGTNGVNMTLELMKDLKKAGLDKLDLSPHSAYHVRRAIMMMREIDMPGGLNFGPMTKSHNWAGQLEKENCIEINFSIPCTPLIEGRGYIQKEGKVSPCCYDYRNLGVFGDVRDEHLLEMPIRPYSLCGECHQEIPEEIWNQERSFHEDHNDQFNRSQFAV